MGSSCDDPSPLSLFWLQNWKRENQAFETILVGWAPLLFSFPDFSGGLPNPRLARRPYTSKTWESGPCVFSSIPLYLHPRCLLFLPLSRPPPNKETKSLLIPSLLSRRAELANPVTLRFVSAKEIAILKSNFKTLETKESVSLVDF